MAKNGLRIQLLGGFSISAGDSEVEEKAWRLRKAKSLVKLLCLAPDRRLHAEEASETLWPERPPDAARNNLHQAVHAARRAIDSCGADGRACLLLREGLLLLSPEDPPWIDVVAFEEAAKTARTDGDIAAYASALELCSGELLPEDRFEDWASTRRESLHVLRLALGVELAELQAAAGERTAAVETLRSTLALASLHEPAHRALMRLYASDGRRQEALAQFQDLKRSLRREFEDEPDDETRRLYQEILTRNLEPEGHGPQGPAAGEDRDQPPRSGRERFSSLPVQLTSFVGRRRELDAIAEAFRGTRLLTLTGAGGSGKTRLALELAAGQSERFSDGVRLVELAAIAEPRLVGPAIGEALDLRLASERAPEVALGERIGEQELLIVLDNCEHLIAAAAHLADALLRSCPNLYVLGTSREPLRVPGEVVWRVPSLSLPEIGDDGHPEAVESSEAVRLFAERAAQVAPGFELDADNLDAVATLCHHLDGMPLAIELAAARAGMLAPAQMVERLDEALDLLAAGSRTALTRQQTLRATLAWSHELLESDERALQRRLAVFAGSFSLEAAEEICATEPLERAAIAELLGRLVDKSLVQVEGAGQAHRYRLLETVRQYGLEQLDAAGERSALEARHLDHYLELAGSDPTPPGDLPSGPWLLQLDGERENLRAALGSALRAHPAKALRLAVAVWGFWFVRGHLAEGHQWLEAVLAAAPDPSEPRARALLAACMFGFRRNTYARIEESAEESAEIFRGLERPSGMLDAVEVSAASLAIIGNRGELEALVQRQENLDGRGLPPDRAALWAANTRGVGAWLRNDDSSARHGFESALRIVRGIESEPAQVLWPLAYGLVLVETGVPHPLMLQEETVAIGRRVGGAAAVAYLLVNLAAVARAEGAQEEADGHLRESLARFRQLGDQQGEAFALNAQGNLARETGDLDRGKDLFERSLAMRERIGDRRGIGLTLGCLAILLDRSGETEAARAVAERCHRWFSHDDDQIGLNAAELYLAYMALREEDRAQAKAHLETAFKILEPASPSPQQGWSGAALAAISIEAGDLEGARGWLDRAAGLFERAGNEVGLARCRQLESEAGIGAGRIP